jgi:hypothetical protein
MRIKKKNYWDFSDIADTISGKLDDLQPLASTMQNALQSVGIQPPSELGDLSQVFHDNIVAPAQGFSSNPFANITSYVAKSITALNNNQPMSQTQRIVATGGRQTLQTLQTQSTFGALFSSVWFWVAIVAVVGGILWLKFRR